MSGYTEHDLARWVPEPADSSRPGRADLARDRARLLHSAGLRRLAQKTQVHRPTLDDFVRNRLTHSLEVAQIGREMGAALGCDPDLVDSACLAHDLGHPPFGHNGEAALAEVAAQIGGFEGNAQTFRLLTRLEAKRVGPGGRSVGLNLTRATLDAATKYPWQRGEPGTHPVKFGVYADDLDAFAWVRQGAPAEQPHRRCLEAQVMDWADDVAYSVHDVEDAIASGFLDPRALRDPATVAAVAAEARSWYGSELDPAELAGALGRALDAGGMPRAHDGTRGALAALKDTTSRLVGRFAGAAQEATVRAHGPGPLRRYAADLVVPAEIRAECLMLKAVAVHSVFTARERLDDQTRQRELLAGLCEAYRSEPDRLDPALRADHEQAPDDAARLRVVVDQVASLTDARALEHARAWT